MIAIFREDTPRRIRDILAAIARGNAEDLSRAGHALKGGAGALGADAMRHLAAGLETLGRSGSTDAVRTFPRGWKPCSRLPGGSGCLRREAFKSRIRAPRRVTPTAPLGGG